jgi:hypothetical protein
MGSIGEFWQGLGKLEKDKFNTELTYWLVALLLF